MAADKRPRARLGLRALGVMALLTLVLGGCASDEVKELGNPICDLVDCSEPCRALTVSACDVAKTDCQDVVRRATECVRGLRFEQGPAVAVQTQEDVLAPMMEMLPSSTVTRPPETAPEPEVVFATHHYESALRALDLLGKSDIVTAATEQSENVGGTYDPMNEAVLVLVEEQRRDWRSMSVLAHEYIHGLQDQERDLQAWGAKQLESGVSTAAYRAFIEGEAELYEYLTLAFMTRSSPERLGAPLLFDAYRKGVLNAVFKSDAPLVTANFNLVYPVGAAYHWQRFERRGTRAVDDVAKQLPQDFAAWMRSDDESTEIELDCNDSERLVSDGVRAAYTGPAGALAVLTVLTRQLRDRGAPAFAAAWELAADWRGDCLEVVGESSGPFELGQANEPGSGPSEFDAGQANEPDAGAGDANAQASYTDSGAGDAGQGSGGVRVGDSALRWTMAFGSVSSAKKVAVGLKRLELDGVERVGKRVTLDWYTYGEDTVVRTP